MKSDDNQEAVVLERTFCKPFPVPQQSGKCILPISPLSTALCFFFPFYFFFLPVSQSEFKLGSLANPWHFFLGSAVWQTSVLCIPGLQIEAWDNQGIFHESWSSQQIAVLFHLCGPGLGSDPALSVTSVPMAMLIHPFLQFLKSFQVSETHESGKKMELLPLSLLPKNVNLKLFIEENKCNHDSTW